MDNCPQRRTSRHGPTWENIPPRPVWSLASGLHHRHISVLPIPHFLKIGIDLIIEFFDYFLAFHSLWWTSFRLGFWLRNRSPDLWCVPPNDCCMNKPLWTRKKSSSPSSSGWSRSEVHIWKINQKLQKKEIMRKK